MKLQIHATKSQMLNIIYGSIIYTRTNNKLLISFLNVMNYDYGLIGYNRASSKWKLCTSKKSAIFFNIYSDPCLVQYVYGYSKNWDAAKFCWVPSKIFNKSKQFLTSINKLDYIEFIEQTNSESCKIEK